jgi:hypothetical protein
LKIFSRSCLLLASGLFVSFYGRELQFNGSLTEVFPIAFLASQLIEFSLE